MKERRNERSERSERNKRNKQNERTERTERMNGRNERTLFPLTLTWCKKGRQKALKPDDGMGVWAEKASHLVTAEVVGETGLETKTRDGVADNVNERPPEAQQSKGEMIMVEKA